MPRDITQLNDEDLEKVEGNIVNAILGAAAYRDKQNNRRLINIKRKGKLLFQFTIEPIDEDTWQKCRRGVCGRPQHDPAGEPRRMLRRIHAAASLPAF